jgi:HK97 family phage prohead protease
LEHKQVQVSDVRNIDSVDGIAEAIVSVTNIVDSVNDIIVPGAYKNTLKKRNPKGVWSHDTNIPVAKTLRVEELMPGDPRLPSDLISKNAGALLVRMQFNLNTSRGRDAFGDVQFFGPEQEWSIGYAVAEGKSETGKDGIRRIKELELYEYSPVIFGAAPHTRTLNVKNADDIIEGKANPDDVKVGDFVSWNSSGGVARGRIEHIMRDGVLGVPDSDFSINASPEDPAALIRIYKQGADGWEETETLVGHKVSTLRKIDALKSGHMEDEKAVPAIYSDIDFSIPTGVKNQAELGLKWSNEYGRGGTSVGRGTAGYLMNNSEVSPEKVRQIARYFPRHEGEQSLPQNSRPGSPGYPGNGLIAWKLWGGDPGRRWAEKLVTAMNSRDEQKDVFTGSPTGMPSSFGTPQGIDEEERYEEDSMHSEQDSMHSMEEYANAGLNERQMELVEAYCESVEEFGLFDQSFGANGAHYAEENPFGKDGMKCSNCVFFEGGQACHIVSGTIKPDAICKLWVINETLLNIESESEDEEPMMEEPMMEDSGVKSVEAKALISPNHSTRVDDTSKWVDTVQYRRMRSPASKSYYDKIFGAQLPNTDGDQKTHYTYVHHFVNADGTPGAASWPALMNTMALLNGARNGTRLRGEERQKMYNHYKRHYLDFGKKPPELKSDAELDSIMIKNGLIDEPLTPKEQEHD